MYSSLFPRYPVPLRPKYSIKLIKMDFRWMLKQGLPLDNVNRNAITPTSVTVDTHTQRRFILKSSLQDDTHGRKNINHTMCFQFYALRAQNVEKNMQV
jgi:hypothetical protein